MESKKNLKGLKVLVTAGPTREHFDPVRFLSNPSSGKMGFAIAEAAFGQGSRVTLVTGPTQLDPPSCSKMIRVTSADEMYRAVMKEARDAGIIIMAAAVSDYRPATTSRHKIKKRGRRIKIILVPTRDILMELGARKRPGQVLIGFAAETGHLLRNARRKLKAKNLDWIVANRVGRGIGFEASKNRLILIDRSGVRARLPLLDKRKAAEKILTFLKGDR